MPTMPTPFCGRADERRDGRPVDAAERLRLLRVERERGSSRPANSGCATSTPESTIVTGLPGPGGVSPATPIAARHHSVATSGSVKSVTLMRPGDGRPASAKRSGAAGAEPGQHPRRRALSSR